MKIEFYSHSYQCANEYIEQEGFGHLDVVVHLRPPNVGSRNLLHSDACDARDKAARKAVAASVAPIHYVYRDYLPNVDSTVCGLVGTAISTTRQRESVTCESCKNLSGLSGHFKL